MATRNRKDYSKNRDGTGFVPIPHVVLNCPQFKLLTPHAVKLLLDLICQYNGKNNGDLSASFESKMKKRDWRSKTTLGKAKDELLDYGLIVETRKGRLPNKASLYALAWFGLDYMDKYDITNAEYERNFRGGYVRLKPQEIADVYAKYSKPKKVKTVIPKQIVLKVVENEVVEN